MECLYCGKQIGVLRKLSDGKFCSAAHRKAYLKQQNDLAVEFLRTNRPRYRPEVLSVASCAAAPEPVPDLVNFAVVTVRPSLAAAELAGAGQPLAKASTVLPGLEAPAAGGLPGCRFLRLNFATQSTPAGPRPSNLRPRAFPAAPLRVVHTPVRPRWLQPARNVEPPREAAGFVPIGLAWTSGAPEPFATGAICAFAVSPTLRRTECSPATAGVNPAPPARARIEAAKPRQANLHLPRAATWRWTALTWQVLGEPVLVDAPQLRACRPTHAAPLQALVPLLANPSTPAVGAVHPGWSPMTEPPLITLATPVLDSAPRFASEPPRTRSAPAVMAHASATLLSKFHLRLGTYWLAGVPAFEFRSPAPGGEPPADRQEFLYQPEFPRERRWRFAELWRSAPAWSRKLAVSLSLGAAGLFGAYRLGTSTQARQMEQTIRSRISQRAAIEFQDDFRSGLNHWAGAPDWARSWAYDETGFARPGRLALLNGTRALDDYRLEFLGQIDRKAMSWVFRASDLRNYYGTKLVESRRGTAASFSIVRYAVIDGLTRLRMELPLPVTPVFRSLHRIREEVRGTEFTTYMDGQIVDTWSDASLPHGGVGFFADPGEVAYIRWVDVAQNDDLLGRLCSYLSPVNRR